VIVCLDRRFGVLCCWPSARSGKGPSGATSASRSPREPPTWRAASRKGRGPRVAAGGEHFLGHTHGGRRTNREGLVSVCEVTTMNQSVLFARTHARPQETAALLWLCYGAGLQPVACGRAARTNGQNGGASWRCLFWAKFI